MKYEHPTQNQLTMSVFCKVTFFNVGINTPHFQHSTSLHNLSLSSLNVQSSFSISKPLMAQDYRIFSSTYYLNKVLRVKLRIYNITWTTCKNNPFLQKLNHKIPICAVSLVDPCHDLKIMQAFN